MILCFFKFILGAGIYNGNSAGDLAGIQFPKLKRSVYIMNLRWYIPIIFRFLKKIYFSCHKIEIYRRK